MNSPNLSNSGSGKPNLPVTKLSWGFAAAVMPVTPATIKTDTGGLTAGEVRIPAGDAEVPAYCARPARGEAFPIVLVVQEIFGVHDYIKDVCRRFAKLGYCAVAVEMFARQGDVSQLKDVSDIRKIVAKVPDAQVMNDLDAAAAWAIKESNGDPARLMITGFCWGGRIAWLYAAHNQALKAAGAWYGRLEGERTEKTPRHPIDVAGELQAPVLGLYGGMDAGISLDSVDRMRDALQTAATSAGATVTKDATISSEIVVYPDAGHAFHADYRPSYNRDAAEDGWRRLLAWFAKYGS